ncbi:MAG TPA: efflux RND transporter periplasmic adaptor subunit [Steroidobacteraceae bacterium]|jgi:membrane fusion protein (multidrug efflux system)|nr:efflux RND transporter periplasmic adaptor subunit [Steroidobacteraceae bacterium]
MPRYCSALPRLALSLPVVFWLAACGGKAETNGDKPIPVTTQQVQPRSVPMVLEAVGRTEGSKEVEIRARVSGIVEKRLYNEGSFVRAGAPLFQIERAPFEIALAHAKATADQAEATNEQARRESERLKGLLANSAVSKRLAEEAQTAYLSATAQLEAARAAVREAQLNLSYTSVVAPISGVTGRALHSEGSLVTANTDSSLLTTMSQTHPVWVRFALSEAEHQDLRKAGEERSDVGLLLANGEKYGARGHLNFASSTVDQNMGTVQLRAEFPNPQLQILPGQFATVHVEAGTRDVIAVPQSAVLQGDLGRYVWVMDTGGKAAQRAVDVGNWVGQDWIIRNGLNVGDTVILDNLMKLKPGVAVVAQAESANAPAASTAAR